MAKKSESRTALARGKRAILIEVTEEQKAMIQQAAEIEQTTLAHYVRQTVVAAAKKKIEKSEK